MSKVSKIKGFADLFPPESLKFSRIENVAKDVFGRYGYQEMRVPILEKTDLFCRSIGEETDVVQKEMYTFPDRKDRSLTMRPEATAGVMRSYIENKLYASGGVSRLFTHGPMFRYERPQKGRMRQFHQINCEALGSPDPLLDAEMIMMLAHFLTELGLTKLSFEINSLGCRECRPNYLGALADFLKGMHKEKLCDDCIRRKLTNPLRVLDCKVPGCKEVTADAPKIADHLCGDCREHFDAVMAVIKDSGLNYVLNPRLVRGLDYYVRTTFEVVSGDIGSQSSVAGGGRYDGLIGALGGPDQPGVGFACGMERLAMLLPETEEKKPDFHIVALDEKGLAVGLSLAQKLRRDGLSGETPYAAASMKSQMRQANKTGARFCLVLGPDELASESVLVKNMTGGEQETIPLGRIVSYLQGE